MVDFVHAGPARHGVRRYGELIDRAVSALAPTGRLVLDPDRSATVAVERSERPAAPVVHLQFSDHLVEPDACLALVAQLRAGPAAPKVVVTMHDCPGVGHDPPAEDACRSDRYRAVCAQVDEVVVSSHHERRALVAAGCTDDARVIAHVVPDQALPVEPSHAPVDTPAAPVVGLLGFVYPGKGHRAVIDACALTEQAVQVVVIGGPAPGHAALAEELRAHAARLGVGCTITGWVPEADLASWLAGVEVPVVAHRAMSASGSLATWLSARRRPLVATNGYTIELAGLVPGAMVHYDPGAGPAVLARAIDRAVAHPERTRRSSALSPLTPACIGAEHLALYDEVR